ncbi:hypothetical protein BKA69DRAFT_1126743 [Paraphysoderma sedebokerense]|nr:hypothetical protein BKA69DRAFT_1126743 [Paraphysoderma sedebokerense]
MKSPPTKSDGAKQSHSNNNRDHTKWQSKLTIVVLSVVIVPLLSSYSFTSTIHPQPPALPLSNVNGISIEDFVNRSVILKRAKVLSDVIKFKTVTVVEDVQPRPPGPQIEVNRRQETNSTESLKEDRLYHFKALHSYLERNFPLFHKHLTKQVVNEASLLFTWNGSKSPSQSDNDRNNQNAIMFLAHMDVVPARPENPTLNSMWLEEPFDGVISDDGEIWGRGALDNKGNLVAIFEAVEYLLSKGYQPQRTFYFGFGHDEEIGGFSGAKYIAETLQRQNVKLDMLWDEGFTILENIMPGLEQHRVGLIGIAEKGMASYKISISSAGGHASFPPPDTPITHLARIITKIQLSPPPMTLDPLNWLNEYLLPYRSWYERLILNHQWLFGWIVKRMMKSKPKLEAIGKTTYAFTQIRGGTVDNVIPFKASVTLHTRIIPGETVSTVQSRLESLTTSHDPRPSITLFPHSRNPSPITSTTNSPFFQAIAGIVKSVYDTSPISPSASASETMDPKSNRPKRTLIAPSLFMANTDTYWFWNLTDDIFRFSPVVIDAWEKLDGVHGVNERVGMDNVNRATAVYAWSMVEMDKI